MDLSGIDYSLPNGRIRATAPVEVGSNGEVSRAFTVVLQVSR